MNVLPVRDWIVRNSPLEPSLLEGAGFESAVSERASSVAEGDEQAYLELLRRSPDELERLLAGVAVPETWLFRYPGSFELLLDHLIDLRSSGLSFLRMASVGCATGQEPCCMAMTALHAGWAADQICIDAWDRNPEALSAAATGRYGPASIRGELPAWAARFLEHAGEQLVVDPIVLHAVRYLRADIAAWTASGSYHVIFCRNVLIYLNRAVRTTLLRTLCGALVPGGLLFVGHAEQFIRDEPSLQSLARPHTFAFQRVLSNPPPSRPAQPPPAVPRSIPAPRPASARPAHIPQTRAPAAPTPQPESILAEARALADAGRLPQAESQLNALLGQCGPSAPAMELLGLIRMAANDAPAAKRYFEQAVYLEPTRAASLLQLAMIWERSGHPDRAETYWARARRAPAQANAEHRS